ncbi:MAG: hypothetical protein JJU10_00860 [Idiomarina sp.]|nr:hypothetical protein [Idiomarina sp.]
MQIDSSTSGLAAQLQSIVSESLTMRNSPQNIPASTGSTSTDGTPAPGASAPADSLTSAMADQGRARMATLQTNELQGRFQQVREDFSTLEPGDTEGLANLRDELNQSVDNFTAAEGLNNLSEEDRDRFAALSERVERFNEFEFDELDDDALTELDDLLTEAQDGFAELSASVQEQQQTASERVESVLDRQDNQDMEVLTGQSSRGMSNEDLGDMLATIRDASSPMLQSIQTAPNTNLVQQLLG